MRIGISPFARTREGSFAVADAAVEGGIDTLWLGDGLLVVDAFPQWSGGMEPLTWLGYLAGRYPGIRVGLGAAALPLRDVQWLAKQSSTLDNLTEGNHVLAVAPGFWEREFAYRSVDYASRGRIFRELLDGLVAAFAGRAHHSPHLELPAGGRLSPEPFIAGGPELWLAGGKAAQREALARGLPFQSPAVLPQQLETITGAWFERGGGLFALRLAVAVAAEVPGEAAAHVSGAQLVGPPSHIAEQLARYARMGVGDLSIIPGTDDETSLATTRALVGEVIPLFRDLLAE